MIARRSDPWLSATLLVISIATLGRAMQVGDGIMKEGTIPWLAIALATCLAGALLPAPRGHVSYGRAELIAALIAVLLCQIGQMLARTPFNEVAETGAWFAHYRRGVVGAVLLAGSMLLARGWLRHLAFIFLLTTYLILGTSVIRAAPSPHIDVFIFQRDACDALMHGTNPYAITMPQIYGNGSPWYAEGMAVDGRLQFGYPYMPLTLLLALPGQAFAGDYRYSLLMATILSAALIAFARPSVVSFGAAALLLLQPRGMYILERGWSDPLVLLTLSATVFCAVRVPMVTPWMLGLFLASKQYAPLTLGAAMLLVNEPFKWRAVGSVLGKAALAAVIVTVPLVAWDSVAFWKSAVLWQLQQPYRWDSLSFVAWWMTPSRDLPQAAWGLAFVALILATTATLWRCDRSPAGFAAATALILFSFFAFNKQAFGNYYYVVIGAMCCAVATGAGNERQPCS